MLYVFDHAIANLFVLGITFTNPFGLGFAATSGLCAICQFLRADGDERARRLHVRAIGKRMRLETFLWLLEVNFMLWENALFFVFLFGMTDAIRPPPVPLSR